MKIDWFGEFNSGDHYIYYCGQESLRRNGVAIRVNQRVQNAILDCSLKNDRMISVCFQGKPFNITVIQVYALSSVIHWSTNYMDHQYLNWNYGQTSKSED